MTSKPKTSRRSKKSPRYVTSFIECKHDFEKTNLVTVRKKGENVDTLKCKKCGALAKRHYLSDEVIITKGEMICPMYVAPKKIVIVRCGAFAPQFANLTPDSVHEVIPAPAPNKDDAKGVWVMGVGEPVKVLNGEFRDYKEEEKEE
jgi:hypothetical protein